MKLSTHRQAMKAIIVGCCADSGFSWVLVDILYIPELWFTETYLCHNNPTEIRMKQSSGIPVFCCKVYSREKMAIEICWIIGRLAIFYHKKRSWCVRVCVCVCAHMETITIECQIQWSESLLPRQDCFLWEISFFIRLRRYNSCNFLSCLFFI